MRQQQSEIFSTISLVLFFVIVFNTCCSIYVWGLYLTTLWALFFFFFFYCIALSLTLIFITYFQSPVTEEIRLNIILHYPFGKESLVRLVSTLPLPRRFLFRYGHPRQSFSISYLELRTDWHVFVCLF